MDLKSGREFLMIPGPTTVPDTVLSAMHRPAIDIYGGEILDLTKSCFVDLGKVFRTDSSVYIYAANGHGAWEAALTNTLSRGDRVLVLESGRFATGWGDSGRLFGLDVEVLPGSWRHAVDPGAVQRRLQADAAHAIKAVLVVQVDTASGVVNDIPAIRAALDAAGHPALLMVDLIASLGILPFEMDRWGCDVAVAASQKGLMMTPGLSFTAANDKAQRHHAQANLRTNYWDWTLRDGAEHYRKFCGTCPEHMLFGLRQSLDLILGAGLETVWERHRVLAQATRAAVTAWAEGGALDFNIERPEDRADAVTVVRLDGKRATALQSFCKTQCGVTLGVAIGDLAGQGFRIAHMGHVNAPTLLGALGSIELGLQVLDIPHGAGVAAAINSLAQAMKGA